MSGVVLVHGLLLVFTLQPHEAAKSDAARGPLLVARAIWCVLGREIRQHRELQHLVQTISHRLVGRLDGGRRVEIKPFVAQCFIELPPTAAFTMPNPP